MNKPTYQFGSKIADTGHLKMKYDIVDIMEEMRLPGENHFDTARRVLTHNALARTGGLQTQAGKLLHVSARVMNYCAQDLRLRPIDRLRNEVAVAKLLSQVKGKP
jgi:hypothetical protein